MSLNAADIAVVSQLLDEAMDLPIEERGAWLAALPAEHERHRDALRDMPSQKAESTTDARLDSLPRLSSDESVAHGGDRVGPYRLIREIGQGGMGSVWLAERADGAYKRQVALKLPRLAWGAGLAERMARERDIGALLEHANIARLYDAGVDDRGRPFIAMELVDGQAIDAWCAHQKLDVRARLRLFIQVARAVAYAHGRLVIHRDLKPSNVLVSADGQAHLLDFGIAKLLRDAADATQLTQEQGRVLTPHYASPEQVRGETITVASDVYSLGVLLYQLLTAVLPYNPKRNTLGAIEEAILEGEPSIASSRVNDKATAKVLHGELDAILAKALKREPHQRYQTVDALVDDIGRYLNGECVLAQPDSRWYRFTKVLRRHWLPFAAAGVSTLAVVAGAGVAVWQARKAQEAAERSRVVKEFVVDVFRVNAPSLPGDNAVRQLPAEALLQRGAQLIATKFPDQPEMQVDLYGIVGGIFAEMGAPQLAVEYEKRHIDALKSVGASAAEEAVARIQLASALLQQDLLKEARLEIEGTVAMSKPYPDLHAKAMVVMARTLARTGRRDEAVSLAHRIEAELDRTKAPSASRAQAKRIRAQALVRSNKADEAFALYRSAIEEAVAAEGPLSPTAVDIRLEAAYPLLMIGRADEARMLQSAALEALRASGGAGTIRAAMEESNIAFNRHMYGVTSFDEARTIIERDRAYVASRGSLVPDSIKASIDFDLGWAYSSWGNVELADRLISTSTPVLRQTRQNTRDIYFFASAQGEVAASAGRHVEADKFLREALESRKVDGDDKQPWAASDYFSVAMNLNMQQRFDEAEAFLASAPTFDDMKGGVKGVVPSTSVVIQLALALTKLERGDAMSALALLPDDETVPEGGRGDASQKENHGTLLCALGRRSDGLPLLEQAMNIFERYQYEHSPALANLRSTAGLCALADGQRKRAVELAQLARKSLEAQPGVSPYYKRPLIKLEQLLRRG